MMFENCNSFGESFNEIFENRRIIKNDYHISEEIKRVFAKFFYGRRRHFCGLNVIVITVVH